MPSPSSAKPPTANRANGNVLHGAKCSKTFRNAAKDGFPTLPGDTSGPRFSGAALRVWWVVVVVVVVVVVAAKKTRTSKINLRKNSTSRFPGFWRKILDLGSKILCVIFLE